MTGGAILRDVEVVVGIIVDGGRFLVERRRMDEAIDPGLVALPGGHVEESETREEALRRELQEELGIRARGLRYVGRGVHVASNGERMKASYYLVTEFEGHPLARTAQEVFWEDDILNLDVEADRDAIARVRDPPDA